MTDLIDIVEYVQGSTFTVIERNKENKVTRRPITIGWGYTRGFAAPKYEEETPKKSVDEVAREVLNGPLGTARTEETVSQRKATTIRKISRG